MVGLLFDRKIVSFYKLSIIIMSLIAAV